VNQDRSYEIENADASGMLDKLKFDTGDDPQAAKLKVAATI
jgi:hypothetical protein